MVTNMFKQKESIMWYLFSIPIPIFIFVIFLFKHTNKARKKPVPPSPPKIPIIGNLHQLGTFAHRSLQSLAQKHGPLMLLHFGSKPVLVVTSAEAAQEILKKHDLNFSSKPKSSAASRLIYGCMDVAFSPYGEYWRQVRSICVIHLLGNKSVESYRKVREEETSIMIENIRRSSTLVNLSDLFLQLTNDIVCRVALGRKYGGYGSGERSMKKILEEYGELLGAFNVGDYIPCLAWLSSINGLNKRMDRAAKEMDEFLEQVLEEHIVGKVEGKEREDFVDILLQIQRNKLDGSIDIQRDTIKGVILDMFGGGTETVHTVLEWAMAELLRHPHIMKKLQNEVRQLACGKPIITEDDLERLDYLKAVIKETLRVHTPIPLLMPRESINDVNIMGYEISAGTTVIINAWAIARDPLMWQDPKEFKPERFLNSLLDYKGHDFEFTPFGAGRRGCPAMHFAMKIDELALANVVLKFDLSLPNEEAGKTLDMSEVSGMSVQKKHPLIVVATPYSC